MNTTVEVAVMTVNGKGVQWTGEYAGTVQGWVRVRQGARIDEVPAHRVRVIDENGWLLHSLG